MLYMMYNNIDVTVCFYRKSETVTPEKRVHHHENHQPEWNGELHSTYIYTFSGWRKILDSASGTSMEFRSYRAEHINSRRRFYIRSTNPQLTTNNWLAAGRLAGCWPVGWLQSVRVALSPHSSTQTGAVHHHTPHFSIVLFPFFFLTL